MIALSRLRVPFPPFLVWLPLRSGNKISKNTDELEKIILKLQAYHVLAAEDDNDGIEKPDKQIATLNRNPDQHGVQIHEGTGEKSIATQSPGPSWKSQILKIHAFIYERKSFWEWRIFIGSTNWRKWDEEKPTGSLTAIPPSITLNSSVLAGWSGSPETSTLMFAAGKNMGAAVVARHASFTCTS